MAIKLRRTQSQAWLRRFIGRLNVKKGTRTLKNEHKINIHEVSFKGRVWSKVLNSYIYFAGLYEKK